eukprot:TRINITY_DN18153_c3_g1_i1.p1 TRINITY_DN18153_c3_g1~~TRINITY_DN18153_c3_g1_i1.p1  ORF type:complete len:187 (+),score=20.71 TRINITY_DN18153_c3_g1_i1:97-657(+)
MPVNVQRLLKKVAKSQSTPDFVWWGGPSENIGTRDLAELDQYHIVDKDTVGGRYFGDARYRTCTCQDLTSFQKFGPNKRDLELGYKMKEARPNLLKGGPSFKLDPYGLTTRNTLSNGDRSRRQEFGDPRTSQRFVYHKTCDRDFTRLGACTNIIKTEIAPSSPKKRPPTSPVARAGGKVVGLAATL